MTGEVAGTTSDLQFEGSKRSRIRCILLCVTLITLVGLAVVVAIAISYTSDRPGLIVYPDEVIIMDNLHKINNKPAKEHYIEVLNNFSETYEILSSSQQLKICSWNSPDDDRECIFNFSWLTGDCSKSDYYGYKKDQPCILIAFNEPKNWIPEPYSSPEELPEEMPESLRKYIKTSFAESASTEFLWVSCTGQNPADTEFLGPVSLEPWEGFPLFYFPLRQDTHPAAIPVLALQLINPRRGALIGIKCNFWAKNLEIPHLAAHIEILL